MAGWAVRAHRGEGHDRSEPTGLTCSPRSRGRSSSTLAVRPRGLAFRWSTVQRLKPGDYLLCYLTGISRFIGGSRGGIESFEDDTPIWTDSTFPSRVHVKILHKLTPTTAVPVLDLRDELSVFRNLSNPNYWSGSLSGGSPALWMKEDAAGRHFGCSIGEPSIRFSERSTKQSLGTGEDVRTSIGEVTLPDDDADAGQTDLPGVLRLEPTSTSEASEHTEVQGLLLRLGSAMGLDVGTCEMHREPSVARTVVLGGLEVAGRTAAQLRHGDESGD